MSRRPFGPALVKAMNRTTACARCTPRDFIKQIIRMSAPEDAALWGRVLKRCRRYTTIDVERANQLRLEFPIFAQSCFDNCQGAAVRYKDLTYVEGYAASIVPVADAPPVYHAWLIDKQGAVVDPFDRRGILGSL